MDSTYKEFIVPNGLTYPQKPDSLKVQAGFNKLRLTWLKAKDPSIVRAEVYWNNYTDTFKVDNIPADKDTIVVDILNLDEVTYTLYVKTFDADGNVSIPVEISGTPYGEVYIMSATNREISSALFNDDKTAGVITWDAKTSDLVYSEVRYKTSSNETKTVRILPEATVLNCPDAKPGELFEYRSVFLPPKGVDYVEKEWVTYENPFYYLYPRTAWTAESRNGNHSWGTNGGEPYRVLDGNRSTGWHSKTGTTLPQCLVVDMKESISIHHLILWHLTNGLASNWIYFKTIEVYLSDTPVTPDVYQPSWGDPVAVYEWPGGFDGITIELNPNSIGQYLVLYFPDSRTNTYISFTELEVYGL
jgi:hypothetical protein